MKRTIFAHGLVYALLAAAAMALGAQETAQSNPYQGTSNPPPDDTITTPAQENAPAAKPSPSHRAYAAPQSYSGRAAQPAPPPDAAETVPTESLSAPANDNGIVQVAPAESAGNSQPSLSQRPATDPDGDIVHLAPPPPGELGEGTTIRVRLLDRLSTSDSQSGEPFHTRVASDVVQDGQVLIPAGSEIDGQVISVSTGHAGGHGSMRLRPETVTLPDGSRFSLYAELSGAPGSRDRVGYEGLVTPGSRLKTDGIETGATIGTGAVTGAILGGPAGALAGTVVGATVISVHLLVSHPQATLDDGSVLLFTLSEPLNLVPAAPSGN
ncbi:MAG: hypothetical protein WBP85_08570 [Terracidiphilus sp.]